MFGCFADMDFWLVDLRLSLKDIADQRTGIINRSAVSMFRAQSGHNQPHKALIFSTNHVRTLILAI